MVLFFVFICSLAYVLACTACACMYACFNYHLYSNTQRIGNDTSSSGTPSGMSIHYHILWCAFDTTLFLFIFIGEFGEKPSTPIIPIVVGVVGAIVAVLVLILLVVAVIFCYKKCKNVETSTGLEMKSNTAYGQVIHTTKPTPPVVYETVYTT